MKPQFSQCGRRVPIDGCWPFCPEWPSGQNRTGRCGCGASSNVRHFQTGTGTATESPQKVTDLELQVYPNPAFGSTSIVVRTPGPTYASLTIWDARGRRIARIMDELLTAGTHRSLWNAELTSPGLYIVRLETGEKIPD